MRISTSLATKISGYSVLASALISAKSGDAQIIHKAINETLTPLGERALPIDLNGDGSVDVLMTLTERRSRPYVVRDSFFAIPENGASIIYTTAYNGGVAALGSEFPVGSQLPPSKRWSINKFMAYHYQSTLGFFSYAGGPWAYENKVQRYVGVRIINEDGRYCYGWIRCKIDLKGNSVIDRLTVIDFDLNTVPNKKIYTSTRSSGDVAENKSALESGHPDIVYAVGKNLYVNLNDDGLFSTNLSLYNPEGQMVYTDVITSLNQKIDLINLPAGMYVAELENSAKRKSFKIILQ